MNNPSPRFTGIFIPVEILENDDLTLLEQMLLAWIDALYCKEHKGCYAKNDYFAKKLKVKENTIAKALTSLRRKGLLIDVSFDGRNRVIRAQVARFVEKTQSNPALDLDPTLPWIKIQPSVGPKSNHPYIESKEESKEYTPLISPHEKPANAGAAKAAEKKKKISIDFPEEIKLLSETILKIITQYKPTFPIPRNKIPLMSSLDLMIREDRRDPQKILDVLRWALADSFWCDKMFRVDIARYLRRDNLFDRLEEQMKEKSTKKTNSVDRRTQNIDGTPVDAPHLKDLF